jgi:hypothetical protein
MEILEEESRPEAIEIGSALRSQSFFHNINYEPEFLDSTDELYECAAKEDVEESSGKHAQLGFCFILTFFLPKRIA